MEEIGGSIMLSHDLGRFPDIATFKARFPKGRPGDYVKITATNSIWNWVGNDWVDTELTDLGTFGGVVTPNTIPPVDTLSSPVTFIAGEDGTYDNITDIVLDKEIALISWTPGSPGYTKKTISSFQYVNDAFNNISQELDILGKYTGKGHEQAYIKNSNANYIKDAVDLTDADNKLDAAIATKKNSQITEYTNLGAAAVDNFTLDELIDVPQEDILYIERQGQKILGTKLGTTNNPAYNPPTGGFSSISPALIQYESIIVFFRK